MACSEPNASSTSRMTSLILASLQRRRLRSSEYHRSNRPMMDNATQLIIPLLTLAYVCTKSTRAVRGSIRPAQVIAINVARCIDVTHQVLFHVSTTLPWLISYIRPAAAIMAKSIMLAEEVMWLPALSPSPDSSASSPSEVGDCERGEC